LIRSYLDELPKRESVEGCFIIESLEHYGIEFLEVKMPFKKIDVKRIVDEKRNDIEFNETYLEIEKEYDLIRQVVEARKQRGMTQKSLAEKAGISQQELSRFEREKHIPKLSNFIRILDALDMEMKIEKKKMVSH
jgi:DNA-binding XRE family transcriptional regulator